MKIYTRTGDNGSSGLIGGQRVSKGSLRIEAIGAVDEANAFFGCVQGAPEEIQAWIPWIQSRLFELGAELANPALSTTRKTWRAEEHVTKLEASIDEMEAAMPKLANFILPGGLEPATRLHVARSVTRRAERHLVSLNRSGEAETRVDLMMFLNRLSDWAFSAARYVNHIGGVPEKIWKGEEKQP